MNKEALSHDNYLNINRRLWNGRTQHHYQSKFYDNAGFIAGKNTLNDIELPLLGNLQGKTVAHLQCHFGQDSLSMARMGASVTGIDLSDEAIKIATQQAQLIGMPARFIVSDVYGIDPSLDNSFDIVFSSYGTIGWLPDMQRWAAVVARLLKPGGHFVFAEFHAAVWMFDNDFTHVAYSYFNREQIIETETGTYADRDADLSLQSVTWNHDLGEVLQSLLDAGLHLQVFREYDYSPYNCLANMVDTGDGKFMIKGMEGKLPLVYALKMKKQQ